MGDLVMTFRRLSSSAREKLYDAEAEKARDAGLGDLPICVHCGFAVDGTHQRWDAAHDPDKPRWLGGDVVGIAHARCNRKHNNDHDTPLYWRNRRIRQARIGAKRSLNPLPGGRDDRIRKKVNGEVVRR